VYFATTDEKREGSGPNGSKHYMNSASSYVCVTPESNFDLLLLSLVTHVQTFCLLFVCPEFDLHSDDGTPTYTYVRFEVFTAVTMKNGVYQALGISSQRTSVASCSLCCS
jgi:hypothetical protein